MASSIDVTLLQSQTVTATVTGPVITIPSNAVEPVSWFTTSAEAGVGVTLTLLVEVSADATNWFELFTHTITTNTTAVNGVPIAADATHPALLMKYARSNCTFAGADSIVIEHHLTYGLR